MVTFPVGERDVESHDASIACGRRCGTAALNEFQKARIRSHLASMKAAGFDESAPVPIVVPVHIHVIHDGAEGKVPEERLARQLDVLNASYNPRGISFTRALGDRSNNGAWFRMTPGSAAERQAMVFLGAHHERQLNLYVARPGAGLLGWATFPFDLAGDPARDGVVILDLSLPGGPEPHGEGQTAVHEVAHWLGLFPASQQSGAAPTTNHMDFTVEAGMTEFRQDQIARVRSLTAIYRPQLLGPALAKTAFRAGIDLVTGGF